MTMNINDKVLHLLNPAVDIGFNISEIADELNIKNAEAKAACLSLIAENKIRTSPVLYVVVMFITAKCCNWKWSKSRQCRLSW